MTLKIAPGLQLPDDAVTQTFGILAKRGAGKSNAAAVMAEAMHKAELPFVVVDPVGAWWGLRSSADGKGPGLAIPIFGGYHGDVPLESGGGELVADLIVDEHLSCVLDVSAFESEGQKRRFLAAFAERLFRQKGKPGNGDPLHLFLEEADDYAPQKGGGIEINRTLGAFQRIVKQGRARGLGATMITQRSAVLNKDLLTQIETLIVLRTSSPQDRKAIAGWIEYHGQSAEILESLSSLGAGEAWVWSPWLNLTKPVQFPRRSTFDSGATPMVAGKKRTPATLADVDLEAIATQMKATIEKAKAEDPRELRKRIAELEKELQRAADLSNATAVNAQRLAEKARREAKRVEVPVLTADDHERLDDYFTRLSTLVSYFTGQVEALDHTIAEPLAKVLDAAEGRLQSAGAVLRTPGTRTPGEDDTGRVLRPDAGSSPAPRSATHEVQVRGSDSSPSSEGGKTGSGLSKSQQRILEGLLWLEELGITRPRRVIAAAVAKTSSKSSGFEKNISTLRTAGLIDYPAPGRIDLTAKGRTLTNYLPERRATEADLQDAICDMVSRPQATLLRVLIDAYPGSLAREELAARAGTSPLSSGFEKNVSTLRSFELIDYPAKGEVVALDVLFMAGA